MLADSDEGRQYRAAVLEQFNTITLPAYQADWGWLDDQNRRTYFELADWAQAHDLPARGHLLVYPGWTASPSRWFELPKDELRAKLEQHIPRAIRSFAGRGVSEWDVTNELGMNAAFMEELGGIEVAADWFKTAEENLPGGQWYLNETFILSGGGQTGTNQDRYEKQIQQLLDAGAPVRGIGLQGHFGSQLTPPQRLLEILDRFANFNLPILITEFDIDIDDPIAKADYMRDFYTVMFSHPAVVGIIRWGFWEGDMWKPRGHSLTKDWQTTPMDTTYRSLVRGQWWTAERQTTGVSGEVQRRVFKGQQKVTVAVGDYRYETIVEAGNSATHLEVVIP